MKKYTFNGLIAAPFTPLNSRGDLNLELIPILAAHLKYNRIQGAFIIGSTGEGVSLTLEEKKNVMEAWVGEQEDHFHVMALIASNSLKEAQMLAAFADDIGLYGIAILPPFYFKINSVAKLAEYCKELASVVPSLPVYYYHIPALSGVNLPMYDFLVEAGGDIPNLAGVKYTAPDLQDFRKCITYGNGKYDLLWGMDEILLSALAMGAKSGVGSTYNYAAPLYLQMIDAFQQGDLETARQLQSRSIDIVDVLTRYGGIPTGKYFMKYLGLDCGVFRLPVGGIADESVFLEDLRRLDFERYASHCPK